MDLNRLCTGILLSVARATDMETAIKLSQAFGGTELRFPLRPPKGGKLAQAIGYDNAKTLCRRFGGMRFDIPRVLGDYRTLCELDRQGASRRKIARELCTTERTVYRWLRELKDDQSATPEHAPQLPLFES